MKMKNILYSLTFTLLAFAVSLNAADSKELAAKIREGNKAYLHDNYREAEQKYADALIDAPNNPEANYNAGLAFYRLEKYDEAISAFQRAASAASQDLEAKCHYNIGNCLFRQGKLKEALDSYNRANELNRDDEDTKVNIEYVTRLIKELASQKKDEQEKDPLQKLLRELEVLINGQSMSLLKTTKILERPDEIPPDILGGIITNQYAFSEKADYLIVGFQALFTNLPPERLQSTGEEPIQQGLEKTPENEALVALYETFAGLGQGLSQCIQNGIPQTDVFQALSNRFQEARATAVGLVSENISPYVNDLSGRCAEVFNNFYDLSCDLSLLDAPALKECADKFNAIGQELVKELKSRSGQKDEKEGEESEGEGEEKEEALPAANSKTLAMCITNAIEYLKLGSAASKTAEEKLKSLITDAPTNQFVALDNFIKARKEFEDDDQKNNEKQQQNQQQQQNDNQNQDQQDQQDQKDQQDQDQNENQDQNQDQQQNQQQQQDQNQDQDQQQQDQQESEEMTKEQAEQMLRAFEEDNSDKEKNRKKMPGAIVPVDKNW